MLSTILGSIYDWIQTNILMTIIGAIVPSSLQDEALLIAGSIVKIVAIIAPLSVMSLGS